MKIIILLLILSGYEAIRSVEEHYWRDFNGLLPTDALVGGTDESGETMYIGQFSIISNCSNDPSNIDTIIATLYTGHDRATASYNGNFVYSNETSNVKVLCVGNKNRFRWGPRKSLYSSNCRYVVGGIEDGVPLHIGKASHGRAKVTGKVFSDTSYHSDKLIVGYEGKEITFDNFDILTHCV